MWSLPPALTHQNACECIHDLQGLLAKAKAGDSLVIDASAVTTFDSSALAVLLHSRRAALAAGHGLTVQNFPTQLQQLAELYGVAELLTSTQ